MTRYHLKQTFVTAAVKWDGTNLDEVKQFLGERFEVEARGDVLVVSSPNHFEVGDWVLDGGLGAAPEYVEGFDSVEAQEV